MTGLKIGNDVVTSVTVKNRSLLARHFKAGQLPTVAPVGSSPRLTRAG